MSLVTFASLVTCPLWPLWPLGPLPPLPPFFPLLAFLSDAPYFGLALYLTSVTTKGRVLEEQPEEQTDSGGSQVTQFSGILLPFLLKSTTQSSTLIHQMHLPLFAKREQLHELVTFPPLDMARTFYMPLSSPRGLFSELLKVPFFIVFPRL